MTTYDLKTSQGPTPSSPPTSLRERKKAKTRAALIAVSQRLFAEKGYVATTLDDICEEVEIRPQTLLRYFESKAHLALAPASDPLDGLGRLLADPDRTLDTLSIWRRFLRQEAGEAAAPTSGVAVSYLANMRAFRQWADKDPVLVAQAATIERSLRDMLAAALTADQGVEADDLHSTLVAALLVAGRTAVWDRWLTRDPEAGSLADDLLAVVDYVVQNLPRTSARRLLRVAE